MLLKKLAVILTVASIGATIFTSNKKRLWQLTLIVRQKK